MSRPRKCRWINCEPTVTMFKPRGIPTTSLDTVTLKVDEFEALRLKDLEGLEQEKAAAKMNVSQPTLHRILESAHLKVADSLVHGKALVIEGGDYVVRQGERLFKCHSCQNEWQEPYGTGRPDGCPKCKSTDFHRAPQDRGYGRHGTPGVAVDMGRIRIAIPCSGQANLEAPVSSHFGRCDSYAIVTLQDGKIESVESLSNTNHSDCSSPVRILAGNGVDLMLVAGMGMRPYLSFKQQGIEVRYGVAGTVAGAVQSYIDNETVPLTEDTLCGCHDSPSHNHSH